MTGTPTHKSWMSMIHRCTYEKHVHYHNYGGRGIKVCERWKTFENFLADMGERLRPPERLIPSPRSLSGPGKPGSPLHFHASWYA